MQKINIVIQARMSSTRLPRKVLKPVMGKPLLSLLLERVRRVHAAHSIIIATSTNPADIAIEKFCHEEKIPVFKGSEDNVLDRYYQTALQFPCEAIVRITSDCPLIDPSIIDEAIHLFIQQQVDYVSNTLKRTFPRGMDVEVFSFKSLEESVKMATKSAEKEHVTPYIYQHPEKFKLHNFTYPTDISSYRLTVDTPEDFLLITKIYETLYPNNKNFTLQDILKVLKKNPEWKNINADIKQKEIE